MPPKQWDLVNFPKQQQLNSNLKPWQMKRPNSNISNNYTNRPNSNYYKNNRPNFNKNPYSNQNNNFHHDQNISRRPRLTENAVITDEESANSSTAASTTTNSPTLTPLQEERTSQLPISNESTFIPSTVASIEHASPQQQHASIETITATNSCDVLENRIIELQMQVEQLRRSKEEAIQQYNKLLQHQSSDILSQLHYLESYTVPEMEECNSTGAVLGRGSTGIVKEYKSDINALVVKNVELPYVTQDTIANIITELRKLETMFHHCIPPIAPILGYTMHPSNMSISFIMPKYECNLFDLIHHSEYNSFCQTMNQKRKWIISAVKCVQWLHNNGIIHKNLKPTNFLVKSKQQFELLSSDFSTGFSMYQKMRDENRLGNGGSIGVTRWMAPEVAQDLSQSTVKSDIYSLSIIIWEILSSTIPFEGMNWISIMILVSKGIRPPVDQLQCNEKWIQLLHRCWNEDPKQRMNCNEILEWIDSME